MGAGAGRWPVVSNRRGLEEHSWLSQYTPRLRIQSAHQWVRHRTEVAPRRPGVAVRLPAAGQLLRTGMRASFDATAPATLQEAMQLGVVLVCNSGPSVWPRTVPAGVREKLRQWYQHEGVRLMWVDRSIRYGVSHIYVPGSCLRFCTSRLGI